MSILRRFSQLVGGGRRNKGPSLRQYVGDGTILLCSEDDIFVYLDAHDTSLTPCLLRDGAWEPQIARLLERVLKPGDCFVDIGANNGIHGLRAASIVGGGGLVVAFEPQQRLVDLLERSISANIFVNHMHVRRLAIGDSRGVARLGKFAHFTGSATLTENERIVAHEEVAIAPFDLAIADLADELGRPVKPDVIKIDVEGFECQVWAGMKDWARARSSLTIIIEYSPVSYRDMDLDPMRLLEEFAECGFSIGQLLPDGTTSACKPEELAAMAAARRQFDLVLVKA